MSTPALSGLNRRGPAIVPMLTKQQGGVDPLGLRQVNLDLMALCLPGITNATYNIRPFSLLCWIHWKFQEQAKASGLSTVTREQQRRFQQKVETLFTWGHLLNDYQGLPGLRSPPPAPEAGGWTDLSFKAWGRKPANTSLQAAVQYGPALKVRSGYGFAEPADEGFFHVTPLGEQLAQHLDGKLRKADGYGLICDLDRMRAREKDANELFKHWEATEPTAAERNTFRSVFFQASATDDSTSLGLRSATISAILEILKKAPRGLNEDEIRRALAWSKVPRGRAVSLSNGALRSSENWLVLQLRQAQRAALESILHWLERQIVDGITTPEALREKLWAELNDEPLSAGGSNSCKETLRRFTRGFKDLESYIDASAEGHDRCLFNLMDRLINSYDEPTATVLHRAVALHLATLAMTGWLQPHEQFEENLKAGTANRIALTYQLERWNRFADRPFKTWMADLLERWILGQHLSVATLRYDGASQRLRFSLEEDGLEFYATKPFRPIISRDHLAAALSLMTETQLVAEDENERFSLAEA